MAYGATSSARDFGGELGILGQAWLDLNYTYSAIFDSDLSESLPWSQTEAITEALADVWLYQAQRGVLEAYPGNDLARTAISGRIAYVKFANDTLSTRLLFECASSIDELLIVAQASVYSAYPDSGIGEMVLTALKKTEYGLPYQWANFLAGRLLSPSTILALIDFALNPPILGLGSTETIDWTEMYPPTRFAVAAGAIGKAAVSPRPTKEEMQAFRKRIEINTDLRYAKDSILSPHSNIAEALDGLKGKGTSITTALTYVASRVMPLRFSDPSLISHFGQAFIGSGATRMLETGSWNDALLPFIEVHNGKKWFYREGIDPLQASVYMYRTAADSLLDEVISGVGPVDLDHLPIGFATENRDWLYERMATDLGIQMMK